MSLNVHQEPASAAAITAMDASPLLVVENLQVDFKTDEGGFVTAVRGVSFEVGANETVALVGESGSGKSVSSLAVMGLLPPETAVIREGRLLFRGDDLRRFGAKDWQKLRGRQVSMIFQDPMASLNPVMRVGDQIAEVLRLHQAGDEASIERKVVSLLDEVGIVDAASKVSTYPHQMSGGQQQRVMIAMALACEPQLLIADEPTTALDVSIQRQILTLLADLQQRRRMSILFITHDLSLVREIADRVLVMRHGNIVESGSVERVFQYPQHRYTQALLACRPPSQGRPRRLPNIEDFLNESAQARPVVASPEAPAPAALSLSVASEPILLEVKNLDVNYHQDGFFRRSSRRVVHNANFTLRRGRTLGIVGESGSGKTTLGMSLLRMVPATGQVLYDGQDLLALSPAGFRPYKRRLQLIFQNPLASLNPRFTIEQVLLEPMVLHGIGANSQERLQRAAALLDRVGLPARALRKFPHEFSGGQCQRIAIARCLTLEPELLVCDESVSALDVSVQAQVLNLLKDLQEALKLTYIFISHDLGVVRYISDDVLVLHHGDIVEQGPVDEVFANPQHAYTRDLLAAIPGRH